MRTSAPLPSVEGVTVTTSSPARVSSSPKRLYRLVSIAEAVTWTLLIIGMIAKYAIGFEALVFPFGLAHGVAFLSYGATALLVGVNQRWRVKQVCAALLTTLIPYATVPFDRWLERRGMLDGAWRLEASDDPRDRSVIDRLVRWGLRNPLLLLLVVAVAVAVIVTVLLQLGPPTEWGR